MKIYSYDRVTGAYHGSANADESPMDPGVFLIPAFATTQAPPTAALGFEARFDSAADLWELVAVAPPQIEVFTPLTPAQRVAALRVILTDQVNITAQAFGYDSIDEAVTYADEPAVARYQIEGRALRAWRSMAWAAFDAMAAEVLAFEAIAPTTREELLLLIPVFIPPDVSGL